MTVDSSTLILAYFFGWSMGLDNIYELIYLLWDGTAYYIMVHVSQWILSVVVPLRVTMVTLPFCIQQVTCGRK